MRIGNGFLLIVYVWFLTACAGPDPAIKVALDQRIALIRSSEVAHAVPKMASIRPLKMGQWVQTKRIDSNGAVSLTTIKIVGQEGPAFWTEIVRENHEGRNVIQILVDYGDSIDPTTSKILSMKAKDGQGRVLEAKGGGSLIDWFPNLLNVRRWDGFPQEDLEVRGGRFGKAYRGTFDVVQWCFQALRVRSVAQTCPHNC